MPDLEKTVPDEIIASMVMESFKHYKEKDQLHICSKLNDIIKKLPNFLKSKSFVCESKILVGGLVRSMDEWCIKNDIFKIPEAQNGANENDVSDKELLADDLWKELAKELNEFLQFKPRETSARRHFDEATEALKKKGKSIAEFFGVDPGKLGGDEQFTIKFEDHKDQEKYKSVIDLVKKWKNLAKESVKAYGKNEPVKEGSQEHAILRKFNELINEGKTSELIKEMKKALVNPSENFKKVIASLQNAKDKYSDLPLNELIVKIYDDKIKEIKASDADNKEELIAEAKELLESNKKAIEMGKAAAEMVKSMFGEGSDKDLDEKLSNEYPNDFENEVLCEAESNGYTLTEIRHILEEKHGLGLQMANVFDETFVYKLKDGVIFLQGKPDNILMRDK